MKAYRSGLYLLGAAALVCGLGGLIVGLRRGSEEGVNARWRKYFEDFYEEPEDTRETWDIPLGEFQPIIAP